MVSADMQPALQAPLARTVEGFHPEQVLLNYHSPSSVWVSWSTGPPRLQLHTLCTHAGLAADPTCIKSLLLTAAERVLFLGPCSCSRVAHSDALHKVLSVLLILKSW